MRSPPDIDDAMRGGSLGVEQSASRLHGRRSGKPLAAYQHELLRALLPRLAVDLTAPLDLDRLFATPRRALALEIGFGAGEHLIAAASRERDVGFIGCEPFLNGLARVVADIAAANLENVRLHHGDASEIIEALPDASVHQVFIFYPDPWPKRRQRKRRFMSDEMLAALARIMRPDGELRFATDIDDNCGWTLARWLRSPHFVWTAEHASDWQTPWPDWVMTRYERKALEQGRRPCYLTAKRRRS